MPTLSLKKIFIAIAGIILLSHLKDITRAIQSIYLWFGESLDGIRNFDKGAQAAIAFYLIIFVIVLIFNGNNKRNRKEDNESKNKRN